jgi:peptidoglycan/xylan/chitin deacetylase (PgdA/CDA1 family)
MILQSQYVRFINFTLIPSIVIILFLPSISHAETSCKCVAFTLDGVQDYFLTNVQMDIIKMFNQKNANLTIGIIGNDFGTDTNMTSFIQNEIPIGVKKSIIEVANNGWKDEDFVTLNKGQQSDRINKTQARLDYLLKTQPVTFLAPNGDMNNDTIAALRDNNLRFASTYWNSSDVPVYLKESGLYIIPPSISTGKLNPETGLYEPIPYDQLVQGITQNITDNGVAVVSMQPLEFAQKNQTYYINQSNQDEIKQLGALLDNLKNMNVSTVTLRGLSETIQ